VTRWAERLIGWYQRRISPRLPVECVFEPT